MVVVVTFDLCKMAAAAFAAFLADFSAASFSFFSDISLRQTTSPAETTSAFESTFQLVTLAASEAALCFLRRNSNSCRKITFSAAASAALLANFTIISLMRGLPGVASFRSARVCLE